MSALLVSNAIPTLFHDPMVTQGFLLSPHCSIGTETSYWAELILSFVTGNHSNPPHPQIRMTDREVKLFHFTLPALPAPATSRAATLIISAITMKIVIRGSKAFTTKILLGVKLSSGSVLLPILAFVTHAAAPLHTALPAPWPRSLSLQTRLLVHCVGGE